MSPVVMSSAKAWGVVDPDVSDEHAAKAPFVIVTVGVKLTFPKVSPLFILTGIAVPSPMNVLQAAINALP